MTLVVVDPDGDYAVLSVRVNILNINDAPTLESPSFPTQPWWSYSVNEDPLGIAPKSYPFSLSSQPLQGKDEDSGDELEYVKSAPVVGLD